MERGGGEGKDDAVHIELLNVRRGFGSMSPYVRMLRASF